jgi:hypothetical protein
MLEGLSHTSLISLVAMVTAIAPLAVGGALAIRPDERRLALMRPLSLAAIFGALTTLASGVINVLQGMAQTDSLNGDAVGRVAPGLAEALIPSFVTFLPHGGVVVRGRGHAPFCRSLAPAAQSLETGDRSLESGARSLDPGVYPSHLSPEARQPYHSRRRLST